MDHDYEGKEGVLRWQAKATLFKVERKGRRTN